MIQLIIVGVAVLAFAGWTWGAYHKGYTSGSEDVKAEVAAREAERKSLTEEVRTAVNDAGNTLSRKLEKRIANIRVENTTINNEITREKEIHRVLTNPDCSYPLTTVKLRNNARRDANAGVGPPASELDRAVPSAAPAPGGPSAAPSG